MSNLRDAQGPYFGEFGGRFVPESLIAALDQLEAFYRKRGFTKQAGSTGLIRSPNGKQP